MIPAPFDVPVDPDADQARRWLADELAKPDYRQGESLMQMIQRWITEQLDKLQQMLAGAPGGTWLYVTIGVVVLALIITVIVVGPVRARRRPRPTGAVFEAETRTAAQMRLDARRAAEAGDFSLGVIETFRAIVRSLEERAILDELPGRTAHEVPPDTARALPQFTGELLSAADLFDNVSYGGRRARRADYDSLSDLDRRVTDARPISEAIVQVTAP